MKTDDDEKELPASACMHELRGKQHPARPSGFIQKLRIQHSDTVLTEHDNVIGNVTKCPHRELSRTVRHYGDPRTGSRQVKIVATGPHRHSGVRILRGRSCLLSF